MHFNGLSFSPLRSNVQYVTVLQTNVAFIPQARQKSKHCSERSHRQSWKSEIKAPMFKFLIIAEMLQQIDRSNSKAVRQRLTQNKSFHELLYFSCHTFLMVIMTYQNLMTGDMERQRSIKRETICDLHSTKNSCIRFT